MAFEFTLALRLHMTVADLRERMSQAEFLAWHRYLAVVAQTEELAAKKGGAG